MQQSQPSGQGRAGLGQLEWGESGGHFILRWFKKTDEKGLQKQSERLQMEEQPLPRRGGWLQEFLSSSSVSIGILRELDWGVEDFQFIYKCSVWNSYSKEFLLSFFKITFFFFFLLRNFQSVKSKSEMQRALFNKNSGCFRVYQVFYLEN